MVAAVVGLPGGSSYHDRRSRWLERMVSHCGHSRFSLPHGCFAAGVAVGVDVPVAGGEDAGRATGADASIGLDCVDRVAAGVVGDGGATTGMVALGLGWERSRRTKGSTRAAIEMATALQLTTSARRE